MNNICPFLSKAEKKYRCLEKRCAWWVKSENKCAITTLAIILKNMLHFQSVDKNRRINAE